jgi:hypothetical protein
MPVRTGGHLPKSDRIPAIVARATSMTTDTDPATPLRIALRCSVSLQRVQLSERFRELP